MKPKIREIMKIGKTVKAGTNSVVTTEKHASRGLVLFVATTDKQSGIWRRASMVEVFIAYKRRILNAPIIPARKIPAKIPAFTPANEDPKAADSSAAKKIGHLAPLSRAHQP
jgi:hypothetical protein